MARSIITRRGVEAQAAKRTLAEGAGETHADDYSTRLLKYIPAEVVAVYVFVEGIIRQSADAPSIQTLLWIVFGFIFILTPFYLWRVQKVQKWVQLLVSTIAFAVWVFSMGGPFASLIWYKPIYGAVLLPLFTFAVGIIEPES